MSGLSWVERCLAVSLAPMHMMPVPLPELSQSKMSLGHWKLLSGQNRPQQKTSVQQIKTRTPPPPPIILLKKMTEPQVRTTDQWHLPCPGVCEGCGISGPTRNASVRISTPTRSLGKLIPVGVWETQVCDMLLLFPHNFHAGNEIYLNQRCSAGFRQKWGPEFS